MQQLKSETPKQMEDRLKRITRQPVQVSYDGEDIGSDLRRSIHGQQGLRQPFSLFGQLCRLDGNRFLYKPFWKCLQKAKSTCGNGV
jgi:hypothetical protein